MGELLNVEYDRNKVVSYANAWANSRNPNYYDFSKIGGDCTNFASQCVFAGCGVMNYTPTYGWYYSNLNNRAPAWTSVQYLYRFMTTNKSVGPYGYECDITEVEPGDLVQIRFEGSKSYDHTPVITEIKEIKSLENILIAAHSIDCDCRSLSTYENVNDFRFIHIVGARHRKY